MEFWITLWKVVFVATVAVFAGMSVWVTFGGWRDIKKLLARLRKSEVSRDIDAEGDQSAG